MRKDKPNITFDELFEKVSLYITKEEEKKMITKAYLFAFEKHFGQKRRTGEDYIIHPLNVAYILSEINADWQTICAALLHDTIEDAKFDFSKEDIAREISPDCAIIVDGVTKMRRMNFSDKASQNRANFRKILTSFNVDSRIIIVKF